jgi:hypothetical protein
VCPCGGGGPPFEGDELSIAVCPTIAVQCPHSGNFLTVYHMLEKSLQNKCIKAIENGPKLNCKFVLESYSLDCVVFSCGL